MEIRCLLIWTVKTSSNNQEYLWSKTTCKECLNTWEVFQMLVNNRWLRHRDRRHLDHKPKWDLNNSNLTIKLWRKFNNLEQARAKARRNLEILILRVPLDAQSPTSGSEWFSSTSKLVSLKSKRKRRLLPFNQLSMLMDRKNLTKMTIKIRKL